jgi:hypothetical protein
MHSGEQPGVFRGSPRLILPTHHRESPDSAAWKWLIRTTEDHTQALNWSGCVEFGSVDLRKRFVINLTREVLFDQRAEMFAVGIAKTGTGINR